ncbi:MAG: hypothetical protein AAF662_03520 [Pseudomonadota bacterium]
MAIEVATDNDSRYRWIRRNLVKFHYLTLSKQDKSALIQYFMTVRGSSRQQMMRLVKYYRDTGKLVRQQRTINGFARRFTDCDIRLPTAIDQRHSTPSGLTVKKLHKRAFLVLSQQEYPPQSLPDRREAQTEC